MVSLRNGIDSYCKWCGSDPVNPGTWREQVAACPATDCALHSIRAMPRKCMKSGKIDPTAVAAVIAKLDAIDRRWAQEGR
jgi:hypothetical protein